MASTTFTDNITPIAASWLNDVNSATYTILGNGTSYTGVLTLAGTTDSTSTTTGMIINAGGAGIAKALWIGGLANVAGVATLANATDASSSTVGGTVVSGGLAVAKKIWTAGPVNVSGANSTAVTSNGDGSYGSSTADGAAIQGKGSSYDFAVRNWNGAYIFNVATGTQVLNLYGDIIGQPTQSVFNTVSTTVNFAGAATTLNIGKSDGVNTVLGATTFSQGVTLSSALTYGGVTLSAAVTGTGNMVLSASPTFTGTLAAAAGTFSGAVTFGNDAYNTSSYGNMFRATSGDFQFYSPSGGTWRLINQANTLALISVTDAGAVTIPGTLGVTTGAAVGGATPGTGGLAFPATQVAVTDANTLDDYEEGTWTPALAFGGGTTGITYAAQTGNYVKIGRWMFVTFYVELSSNGSSTGGCTITGLPVASATLSNGFQGTSLYSANLTGVSGAITAIVPSNSSSFSTYYTGTGTAVALSDTTVTDTAQFSGSFAYRTAG